MGSLSPSARGQLKGHRCRRGVPRFRTARELTSGAGHGRGARPLHGVGRRPSTSSGRSRGLTPGAARRRLTWHSRSDAGRLRQRPGHHVARTDDSPEVSAPEPTIQSESITTLPATETRISAGRSRRGNSLTAGNRDEADLRVVEKRGSPVHNKVRARHGVVLSDVGVLGGHPPLPELGGSGTVPLESSAQPFRSISVDPNEKREVLSPLKAPGADTLDKHGWSGGHLHPFSKLASRPVVALVAGWTALGKGLDHLAQKPRPPLQWGIGRGEVVRRHDRSPSERNRQPLGKGALTRSPWPVDGHQKGVTPGKARDLETKSTKGPHGCTGQLDFVHGKQSRTELAGKPTVTA